MNGQTFADRYRSWSLSPDLSIDSDPTDYDQYQAWANSQPAPAPVRSRPPRPVFVPDAMYRLAFDGRPCGVRGGLLPAGFCLDCRACPDAPSGAVKPS